MNIITVLIINICVNKMKRNYSTLDGEVQQFDGGHHKGLVSMGSVLQKQVSSHNLMAQEPVSLALLGLCSKGYY